MLSIFTYYKENLFEILVYLYSFFKVQIFMQVQNLSVLDTFNEVQLNSQVLSQLFTTNIPHQVQLNVIKMDKYYPNKSKC